MDVILIAPKETSLRDKTLFREKNVRNDVEVFTGGPMNAVYAKFLKDNLGLCCLASYARSYGYTVQILSAHLHDLDIDDVCDRVLAINPPLVGISLLYDLHTVEACRIARALRQRGYHGHISIGGPFATMTYEYLLAGIPEFDSVVRGEGEVTLIRLLERLKRGEEWQDLPGLAWRDGTRVVVNACGPVVEDLSSLPFAARDTFAELKERLLRDGITLRTASIFTSRGCRGRCTYCGAPACAALVPTAWRCRSVDSVFEEIEYLVREFGIEYLTIIDENFFGYGDSGHQRLYELAHRILDNKMRLRFWIEVRVDISLDPELFTLLRTAGLQDVFLGIESGAQSTLNRYRKGTTVAQNRHAIEFMRKQGFHLETSMILVDPYTTIQEYRETVQFISETDMCIENSPFFSPLYLFNQVIVFPGTAIESQLLTDGLISRVDPWQVRENMDDPEQLMSFCRRIFEPSVRDHRPVHPGYLERTSAPDESVVFLGG